MALHLSTTKYADDCNIYVRSHRAGERVMASVSRTKGKATACLKIVGFNPKPFFTRDLSPAAVVDVARLVLLTLSRCSLRGRRMTALLPMSECACHGWLPECRRNAAGRMFDQRRRRSVVVGASWSGRRAF